MTFSKLYAYNPLRHICLNQEEVKYRKSPVLCFILGGHIRRPSSAKNRQIWRGIYEVATECYGQASITSELLVENDKQLAKYKLKHRWKIMLFEILLYLKTVFVYHRLAIRRIVSK